MFPLPFHPGTPKLVWVGGWGIVLIKWFCIDAAVSSCKNKGN